MNSVSLPNKRGYGVAWIILSGLGPDDPGSNLAALNCLRDSGESPGSPTLINNKKS